MKSFFKITTDSLIISRLWQKELLQFRSHATKRLAQLHFGRSLSLKPCLDPLPIKIGLNIRVLGTSILNSVVERGFFSHGAESSFSPFEYAKKCESLIRLNSKTPHFYQLALISNLEALFQIQPEKSKAHSRGIALEIATAVHHIGVLKNIFSSIRQDQLFVMAHNLESLLLKPLNFFSAIYAPLKKNQSLEIEDIIEILDHGWEILEKIEIVVHTNPVFIRRLKNRAQLKRESALSFGLSGLFLAANGMAPPKARKNQSIARFTTKKIPYGEGGDAFTRMKLRILSVRASLRFLKEELFHCQNNAVSLKPFDFIDFNTYEKKALNFASTEIDSPEGIVKSTLFFDEEKNSLIFRLRTPAYYIAQIIPLILSKLDICDIPLVLYSLGISAEEIDK